MHRDALGGRAGGGGVRRGEEAAAATSTGRPQPQKCKFVAWVHIGSGSFASGNAASPWRWCWGADDVGCSRGALLTRREFKRDTAAFAVDDTAPRRRRVCVWVCVCV